MFLSFFLKQTLWPFLKEVFFDNPEGNNKKVRSTFVLAFVGLLIGGYILVKDHTGALEDRYRNISSDYRTLDESHYQLMVRRRELQSELFSVSNKLVEVEGQLTYLVTENDRLRSERDILIMRLGEINQRIENAAEQCFPDEPLPVVPEDPVESIRSNDA